jgi:hypothetical protein
VGADGCLEDGEGTSGEFVFFDEGYFVFTARRLGLKNLRWMIMTVGGWNLECEGCK